MATVVVVGLGPAGPDLLTGAAAGAIGRISHRWVRTTRHPAAVAVPDAGSFDGVYDQAGSFEEVYAEIVDALAEAAASHGEVLYAVPGSPLVAERTVELLLADDRVAVEVVPGLSFLELVWARLGVDPVAAGVRVVDGRRFGIEAAGERGPLLVAQCDANNRRLDDVIVALITRTTHRTSVEPTQLLIDITTPDGVRSGLLHTSAVKQQMKRMDPSFSEKATRIQAKPGRSKEGKIFGRPSQRIKTWNSAMYTTAPATSHIRQSLVNA